MEYRGKFRIFDPRNIKTYPISERNNKVKLHNLLDPQQAMQIECTLPESVMDNITLLASAVVESRKNHLPVIFFTGAHLVKNGLGLLLVDLVKKGIFTSIAGNMATAIHDFELAMIGETSEYVPLALEKGQFGMAYEFAYMNAALTLGNSYKLGLGEALGKTICDPDFRKLVLEIVARENSPQGFTYPGNSVLATCYEKNVPCTIHVGIGTDVTDQHPSFDGEAKGGCSGRDFLIYTHEVEKLKAGGMVINMGSAVTGPEVFLKAASMTGNVGNTPKNLVTADFDIRPYDPAHIVDESKVGYYYRDQKSIVVRVPEAYGGKGYYIEGNQINTFPYFYKKIIELAEKQ